MGFFLEAFYWITSIRADHFLIAGLIISAIFRKSKDFFINWGPFILLWLTYDAMRGIAHTFGRVRVKEVYDVELLLFGWMFDGQIPSFWFDQYKNDWVTFIAGIFYSVHFALPLTLGLVLFYKTDDDRVLFKQMSRSFILVSYMALLTFVLYPVAPPWYVWNGGRNNRFYPPNSRAPLRESAADLVDFDKLVRSDFYATFYQTFNANPYAAIPSLHAGYSFLFAYFVIKRFGKKGYLGMIYPIGIWFSAVYLKHHYVIDLIIGVIYSYIAIKIVQYLMNRKGKNVIQSAEELLQETPDESGNNDI